MSGAQSRPGSGYGQRPPWAAHNRRRRALGRGRRPAVPVSIVASSYGTPGSALRWRDLRGERLALFASGSTYDLALATLRQQGVALDAADRLLYSESLYSLVRSGLAVGVISRLYTHGLHADDLCLRPLGSPAITRRTRSLCASASTSKRVNRGRKKPALYRAARVSSDVMSSRTYSSY